MKTLLITIIISSHLYFSQTHTRKTRSDKGKTHKHSSIYLAKTALKPKLTAAKKKKK